MRRCFVAMWCCFVGAVLLTRGASACHLPAVVPILPGSNHAHENHSARAGSGAPDGDNYAFQRFDSADLTEACFTGTDLAGSSLRDVSASRTTFQALTMAGADFTNANLRRASFVDVNAFGAVFDGAILMGAQFSNASRRQTTGGFAGASFDGANLSGASFGRQSSFVGASFVGAQLTGVGMDVSADFSGVDFRNADFSQQDANATVQATFVQTDFRGAVLDGRWFFGPMIGANFVGASLKDTRLSRDLRGAVLDGLDLTSALFIRGGTDLRGASLRNATIRAHAFNTRLEGADLRGANLLPTSPQSDALRNVDRFTVFDLATQFPDGFDPTSSDMTLFGDNNDDHVVDVEDLNNVRNHFGQDGPIGLPGDTVFDGVVDIKDLNAVRNAFGTRAVAPVPEPASWMLLLLACPVVLPRLRFHAHAGTNR